MASIQINDKHIVEGGFTFSVGYDMASKPPIVKISGVLVVGGDKYLSDIQKIESEDYVLEDVQVYSEEYGSDTDEIAYSFIAKSYGMAKEDLMAND